MWAIFTIILLFMATVDESNGNPKKCEEKEKSLALLELAKDSILKAKYLIPKCVEMENKTHNNESTCGKKEKSTAYINVALKLINEAAISYPKCDFENIVEPDEENPDDKPLAVDCQEILERGNKKSGIYTIQIFNSTSSINQTVNVFCDMDTDNGGWTVIQRRGNFSNQENFMKSWQSYKKGFGNITKDFWIGNELIYALTNAGSNTLRVDLGDAEGKKAFAIYKDFIVANENDGYRLNIGDYSGNAGNSMGRDKGARFSTPDRIYHEGNECAINIIGGWWVTGCSSRCHLNNLYYPGEESWKNLHWHHWREQKGLGFSEMKIRS